MHYRFNKIPIDKYLAKHAINNPKEDLTKLRKALLDSKKLNDEGAACECGNPIWALGSASTGNRCFTCITGETDASQDFEIY